MIRETAFEGARYVPLAQRAFANWRRVEAATGESLLHLSGVLFVGDPESAVIGGTLASARAHGVAHELLSSDDLARRYPALRSLDGAIGILEPGAGWIDPERSVAASLRYAALQGLEFRFDEPVLGWEKEGTGVAVMTPAGRYRADRLLLAAGPWMPALLGARGATFSVERQVQYWFTPADPSIVATLPIFIRQSGDTVFYALPPAGAEVKVAVHHAGLATTPDTVDRAVSRDEVEAVHALLRQYVPAIAGVHRRAAVCLYTNTQSGHFVIDRHPDMNGVVLASACSGFGFKFASAVGEILADLLTDRAPSLDVTPFRWGAV